MEAESLSEDSLPKLRVLLIDDHVAFSKLVTLYANRSGKALFDVLTVQSIDEAADILKTRDFDLLLLDGRLSDDRSPTRNAELVSEIYKGPIILFSGMIPADFDTSEEYHLFSGAISKDDLPKPHFAEALIRISGKIDVS